MRRAIYMSRAPGALPATTRPSSSGQRPASQQLLLHATAVICKSAGASALELKLNVTICPFAWLNRFAPAAGRRFDAVGATAPLQEQAARERDGSRGEGAA